MLYSVDARANLNLKNSRAAGKHMRGNCRARNRGDDVGGVGASGRLRRAHAKPKNLLRIRCRGRSLAFSELEESLKLELGELDHRSLSILAKAIHDHGSNLTTLSIDANRADPEDQCIQDIRAALAVHGHEDALPELEEMEDYEEEEESEEEEKGAEEEEETEEKKEPTVKDEKLSKELAGMMAKTSLEGES